jgi:hypothetical protein
VIEQVVSIMGVGQGKAEMLVAELGTDCAASHGRAPGFPGPSYAWATTISLALSGIVPNVASAIA